MKKTSHFILSLCSYFIFIACQKQTIDPAPTPVENTAPSITSFSPTSGSPKTEIIIKGKNFNKTSAVTFGGTPASSFTVVDNSTITATVGNGTSGDIQIITPNGNASLAGFTFKPVTSMSTSSILLNIPGITGSMFFSLNGSISGTRLYLKDGVEHLLISPTLFFEEPLIPAIYLIKKNGSWIYKGSYPEGAMGAGRQSELLDDAGTIAFADFGLELRQGTWPAGNMVLAKTNGEQLSWTTISKERSFYHSLSIGDLNQDGRKDIIGLSFGTKGTWLEPLHPYIQQSNGEFKEDRTLISYTNSPGKNGGCVLLANVMGDAKLEIIQADYNPAAGATRYSFAIYSYNTATNKYEYVKTPGVAGFAAGTGGATSMKTLDVDKDGDLDIALAYEIGNAAVGVEIWTNGGNGDFTYSNQKIEFSNNVLGFREFEVADVDNDSYLDIILNPNSGSLFKTAEFGAASVLLHNLVWKNNNGKFEKINTEQKLDFTSVPVYMKAFLINNKLKYIGIRCNIDGTLQITEIEPVF